MYVPKCVRQFTAAQGLATILLFFATSATPAYASPALRVGSNTQCPVSLRTSIPPKTRLESAALGAAILTSVADTLLDAGIAWVKTTLDPSKNEFSDKRSFAMPGLFEGAAHNTQLNCLMIAVFDDAEPAQANFPLTAQSTPTSVVDRRLAGFGIEDPIETRLATFFPGVKVMKPLLYVELVRKFSLDGTAHYYEPVYAYAAQFIRPHFLSKEPVWEISIGWTDPAQKVIGAWTLKFGGTPPVENSANQLALLGATWTPTKTPPSSVLVTNSPFTMDVELKEHRSPTLFAAALQKAADDNAAAAKKLVQDAYPWRQQELAAVAMDAANKARDETRQKAVTYLASLDAFKVKCSSNVTDPIKRASCGLDLVNLQITYDAIKADVTKYKLMPDGFDFPAPPTAL